MFTYPVIILWEIKNFHKKSGHFKRGGKQIFGLIFPHEVLFAHPLIAADIFTIHRRRQTATSPADRTHTII